MRRALVHAGAWALATGAAVTLSWFGVHTVVSGTAYDPPRALPIAGDPPAPSASHPGPEPETDSTRRPRPPSDTGSPKSSRSAASRGSEGTHRDAGRTGEAGASREDAGRSRGTPGNVESHELRGGRVAFDLGPDSAALVSATPNPGWEMRVWRESRWIRVTFSRGEEASSVFCVWHGTPPRVTVDEHGG
jgi:hypothetical protein